MKPETISLGALVPDERNARKHNPRNLDMVERSLQEVGAARSIVIDENNRILAGNGTVEAAGNAGFANVRVIEASGAEIIAVRRTGLTEEQKTKLALYDNRTAELAEWEASVLAELNEEVDLSRLWSEGEMEALLARAGEAEDFSEGAAADASKSGNGTLAERFGIPPFSVFDTKQGYWQERKRAWLALGLRSELGRGGALVEYSETTQITRGGKH